MTRPLSLARPAGTRLNSDYAGVNSAGSAAGERNATPLMLEYGYDGPDAVGGAPAQNAVAVEPTEQRNRRTISR